MINQASLISEEAWHKIYLEMLSYPFYTTSFEQTSSIPVRTKCQTKQLKGISHPKSDLIKQRVTTKRHVYFVLAMIYDL